MVDFKDSKFQIPRIPNSKSVILGIWNLESLKSLEFEILGIWNVAKVKLNAIYKRQILFFVFQNVALRFKIDDSMEKNVTDILAENAETTALIVRDFDLETPDKPMTEAELLTYLSDVIAYMIERKLDYLLSLLYRLDVSEKSINQALMPGNSEDANVALARLVIDRQKKRIATKRAYREQNPSNWNWDLE